MLRCSEVVRLCASDAVLAAPLRVRAAYRIHLLMCRHCRRYVRELRAIGGAVRGFEEGAPSEQHEDLIRRVLKKRPDPPSFP